MLELNKTYLGDCFELMKDIDDQSIDLILTDTPFNAIQAKWDVAIPLDKMWEQYKRIIKPNGCILMFCTIPFTILLGNSNIEWLKYDIVWEKTQASGMYNAKKMPMRAHESILVFYKNSPTYNPQKTTGHKPVNSYTKKASVQNKTEVYGKVTKDISGGGATDRYPRSVLKFKSDKQKNKLNGTIFSTQKPLTLCEYLIKTYTNEGDLVLDPFAGSGTTGLAAKNINRNFIMMEKELKHYELIQHRFEIETKFDTLA